MEKELILVFAFYMTIVAAEADSINDIIKCEYPQEFYECGSFCDNTCATLGQVCNISTFDCNDKCYCLSRYARDEYNNCIPEWQCQQQAEKKNKCVGENEVLKCGSECQNTCSRLGKPCPIYNKKCKIDCYCIDGFARNADGICIPEKECPPGRCEMLFEQHFCNYYPCQTNCANIGKCKLKEKCEETCYCQKGYVRGRDGDCQPEWLCHH